MNISFNFTVLRILLVLHELLSLFILNCILTAYLFSSGETNGDPSSPPPSLIYPPTASPPFMMYPHMAPPGDFIPPPPLTGSSPYPSDSRPPPLGRISSPPLDHRFSPPPPLPYPPYDYPPYGHHSPSPPPPIPSQSHHRNVHKPKPREMSREQKGEKVKFLTKRLKV